MQVLLKPTLGSCGETLVSSVFPTPPQGKGGMLPCLQGEKRKIVRVRGLEDGKKAHALLKKWGSAGQTKAASSVIYCNGFRSEAVLLNPFLCSPVLSHVTRVSHGHQAHLHAG